MSIVARFRLDRGAFRLEVDLQLPARGVSAICGPSGSGKTTLLRAIAGLERVANGYLTVGDCVWQDGRYFLAPHCRAIGFVFQEPSLFAHLNARRNIEYGRRRVPDGERKLALADVVELLGLSQLLDRYPPQLSGGEQQRVAIARALAVSPSVLLLDEPLAALDLVRRRELMPFFETLHRELAIPILYVSHAKDEVLRLGDYLVLLAQGRVQAAGPMAQMSARLDLSLAHEVDAVSALDAVVADRDEAFGLAYLDFPGGRLAVVAENPVCGRAVRLLIRANDVSLALQQPTSTSILNVLPATVLETVPEGPAMVLVRLVVGATPLLARITRKSAVALDLRPGLPVFVQLKSVALSN